MRGTLKHEHIAIEMIWNVCLYWNLCSVGFVYDVFVMIGLFVLWVMQGLLFG